MDIVDFKVEVNTSMLESSDFGFHGATMRSGGKDSVEAVLFEINLACANTIFRSKKSREPTKTFKNLV